MGFACATCGRTFPSERSLNSHKAWHSGLLKSWKDSAEMRENPPSSKTWTRTGRDLIRGFLASVSPGDLSPENMVDLVEKIWILINKACKQEE